MGREVAVVRPDSQEKREWEKGKGGGRERRDQCLEVRVINVTIGVNFHTRGTPPHSITHTHTSFCHSSFHRSSSSSSSHSTLHLNFCLTTPKSHKSSNYISNNTPHTETHHLRNARVQQSLLVYGYSLCLGIIERNYINTSRINREMRAMFLSVKLLLSQTFKKIRCHYKQSFDRLDIVFN